MLKKVLPLVFINILALQAATISTDKEIYNQRENIKVHIEGMSGRNHDWIGIYSEGASNEWKNVLRWSWTNDVSSGDITLKGLTSGSYQVRAFYNNSFKVEARDNFRVNYEPSKVTVKTSKKIYGLGEKITVNLTKMSGNVKDWIGIYPKGSSNEWKNVVRWSWSGGIIDGDVSFKGINKAGSYQARVFFDNSYHLEKYIDFLVKNNDSTIYGATDGWSGSFLDLWIKDKVNVDYAHIQYFIDADLDKNSGFKSTKMGLKGIEYLIEDRKIYKYIGNGYNWKWKYVKMGKSAKYDDYLHPKGTYDAKSIVRFDLGDMGIKHDNTEACNEINQNGGNCDWYDYTVNIDVDVMLWNSSWKFLKRVPIHRIYQSGGIPGI